MRMGWAFIVALNKPPIERDPHGFPVHGEIACTGSMTVYPPARFALVLHPIPHFRLPLRALCSRLQFVQLSLDVIAHRIGGFDRAVEGKFAIETVAAKVIFK